MCLPEASSAHYFNSICKLIFSKYTLSYFSAVTFLFFPFNLLTKRKYQRDILRDVVYLSKYNFLKYTNQGLFV